MESGIISTVAGNGLLVSGGDGGPARAAGLSGPFTIAFDRDGAAFVAESGTNAIRRIGRDGRIATVYSPRGGTAEDLVALTIAGDFLVAALRQSRALVVLDRRRPDRNVALQFTGMFDEPHDVAASPDGRFVYIADVKASKVWRAPVGKDGLGTPVLFAGTGKRVRGADGLLALSTDLAGARAVACAPDNVIYVVEREGHTIRRIGPDGMVATIAGTGKLGYTGDGGLAKSAALRGPKGLACDPAGNLFVVDTENQVVRRIDIRSGTIATVAGNGTKGFSGDHASATLAQLARPHGVALAPDGALWIADTENNRLRAVAQK